MNIVTAIIHRKQVPLSGCDFVAIEHIVAHSCGGEAGERAGSQCVQYSVESVNCFFVRRILSFSAFIIYEVRHSMLLNC